MADSNNAILNDAIKKLTVYVVENYSAKSSGYYKNILEGLRKYAIEDNRSPADIVSSYYEVITTKPAFQRPETGWLKLKARTMFMLLDIINGNEPKREYIYEKMNILVLLFHSLFHMANGNRKWEIARKLCGEKVFVSVISFGIWRATRCLQKSK